MSESPSARAARATRAHLSQFSDEDLAYHESGHAVVHHLHGGTIRRLSIDRDDPRRGCQPAPRPASPRPAAPPSSATTADPKQALADRLALLVGGEVAATLHGTPDDVVTAGGRVDHDAALRAAAEAGFDPEQARAMIDAEWHRVRDRLRDPAAWRLVDRLAQALLQQKTLEEAQITALLTR